MPKKLIHRYDKKSAIDELEPIVENTGKIIFINQTEIFYSEGKEMYNSGGNSVVVIRVLFSLHVILFLITTIAIFVVSLAFNFFRLPNNLMPLFHDPDQISFGLDFEFSEITSLIFCITIFYFANPLLEDYFPKGKRVVAKNNLQSSIQYKESEINDNHSNFWIPKDKEGLTVLRTKDLLIINSLWLCVPVLEIIENLNLVVYNQSISANFPTGLILIMIVWVIITMLIPFRYFYKISKLKDSKI